MFKFCRSCDARTIHVLAGCSICLLVSLKGDELAMDVLQRVIAEAQIELQLDAHPEVANENWPEQGCEDSAFQKLDPEE